MLDSAKRHLSRFLAISTASTNSMRDMKTLLLMYIEGPALHCFGGKRSLRFGVHRAS